MFSKVMLITRLLKVNHFIVNNIEHLPTFIIFGLKAVKS